MKRFYYTYKQSWNVWNSSEDNVGGQRNSLYDSIIRGEKGSAIIESEACSSSIDLEGDREDL